MRWVVVLLAFLVLAGAAWAIHARMAVGAAVPAPSSAPLRARAPDSLRAPSGVRIKVEVVNTTGIRGLGRRATRVLRDAGFDVVEVHTAGPRRDSTLVLDRSHHAAWTSSIARILMPARSEERPDTSRYLDVTVLLGASWRPPAEPLDP